MLNCSVFPTLSDTPSPKKLLDGLALAIVDLIRRLAAEKSDECTDLDYGPVPSQHLRVVESSLATRLPTDFRDYLREFAGGRILGWNMYGIPTAKSEPPIEYELGDDANFITDIVAANTNNPPGHVEFTNDGGDYLFAFIVSRNPDAVFVAGLGSDWMQLCPSFLDFLQRTADGSLSYPPTDNAQP